jgi:hypothetical protein
MTHTSHPTLAPCPALLLFGNDQVGHPHAAWFAGDELKAAERASGALGYAALRLTNVDEHALALRLPRGQLEPDGRVQVPALSPELFQVLQVLVLGVRLARVRPAPAPAAPPPSPQPLPPALLRS